MNISSPYNLSLQTPPTMSSSTYFPKRIACMEIVTSEENIDESVPVFKVVSREKTCPAPRFRHLPTDDDLIPAPATASASNLSDAWDETLVVSGLVKYQDEIGLIADVELLKKLFSTPYTRAGLSLEVQRIGDTLVLKPSPGPEVDEDEGCKTQLDESLYQSFVTQSLRSEDSEESRRRLFICQLGDIQMLVGSKLHRFRNEEELDVNLLLLDVSKRLSRLPWLEAWLQNIMTDVPELGVCHHDNGVLKGYEYLSTSEICSVKQTSAYIVQQNAHQILSFLRSNCKDDPGLYWLYRSPGEDVIQLFHFSSKNHSSGEGITCTTHLTSKMRTDSMFSLGKLLHKLALSVEAEAPIKCATFLTKCLNVLDEQEHMVVRSDAHELFARLLLKRQADFISECKEGVQGQVMIEFKLNDNYSCCYEAVPLSVPETVPILVLPKYLAVYHVRQAVNSLMWSQQLQPASEALTPKLSSQLHLQCEAGLSLGAAYLEAKQQLQGAFNIINQACRSHISLPEKPHGTVFISSMELPFLAESWFVVGDLFALCYGEPVGEFKLTPSDLGNVLEETTTEDRILKFLKSPLSVGVVENLVDAGKCYKECLTAIRKLPDGKFVQTLTEHLGSLHIKLGDLLSRVGNFVTAKDAYDAAIYAFKEAKAHVGPAQEEKVRVYKYLADAYFSLGLCLAKGMMDDGCARQNIREALNLYEGDVLCNTCAEETANAFLELAQCFQTSCMRLYKSNQWKTASSFASLALGNWQKSSLYYNAENFPEKFLATLTDMATFSLKLPNSLWIFFSMAVTFPKQQQKVRNPGTYSGIN
ncbi:uncharacterized protein LOC108818112 isoform X2 [Raphanus sativus]|uniref:Uncharacterized protein LOC108818112 isoform X2 n=1 Tax=Raphanus sativus TaxID=3726 RepID=A0A9W3C6T4_RAPSA|nr:uncharacterized protein LOC130497982 isoform X2 [Raphanus sativus]XP_056847269.1 uncharacterized protein LOC130497987 isoform X2 [Raphanus sativus]XP_056856027.1 uncharacterized protein LOC108818112 isoform X2 [Raphanus sativus]